MTELERNLYKIPTSQLVYYRVFKEEFANDPSIIDMTLERRFRMPIPEPDTSLDTLKDMTRIEQFEYEKEREKNMGSKMYVLDMWLSDEETRIQERGKGLGKYIFDLNKTFNRIFSIYLSNPYSGGISLLTWSEKVIMLKLLKKIMALQTKRIEYFTREIDFDISHGKSLTENPIEQILLGDHYLLERSQNKLLDEKLLLKYFQKMFVEIESALMEDVHCCPFSTHTRTCLLAHPLSTIIGLGPDRIYSYLRINQSINTEYSRFLQMDGKDEFFRLGLFRNMDFDMPGHIKKLINQNNSSHD